MADTTWSKLDDVMVFPSHTGFQIIPAVTQHFVQGCFISVEPANLSVTITIIVINGDGGCSFLAAYRRAYGSSPSAWFKCRQPSGAVLYSSR